MEGIHNYVPMADLPLWELKTPQCGMGAGVGATALEPSAGDSTESPAKKQRV